MRYLLLAALLVVAPAFAADAPTKGCDAFTWDVSRELAVMDAKATAIDTGKGTQPVKIDLGKKYLLRLAPQGEVTLAAKPGKPMLDDAARAGLVTFRVPAAGRYRVSITSGHWLDVVDAGKLIASHDFQGQRGCEKVHKIVEFELPADRDLVLQLSGGTVAEVGVAVTPVAG